MQAKRRAHQLRREDDWHNHIDHSGSWRSRRTDGRFRSGHRGGPTGSDLDRNERRTGKGKEISF